MTFWKVVQKASGRIRLENEQTAALLAMIYNRTILFGKQKPLAALDFYNPDHKRKGTPLLSGNVVKELDKWG